MEFIYNGEQVLYNITNAEVQEGSGNIADSVRVVVDDNTSNWKPKKNDEIILQLGEYSTGTMYLDEYRKDKTGIILYARNIPQVEKKAFVYKEGEYHHIIKDLAGQLNLPCYFLENNQQEFRYKYIADEGISELALINKLCELENMRFKIESGKIFIIDLEWIKKRTAVANMILETDNNIKYTNGNMLKSYTVISRGTGINAYDYDVEVGGHKTNDEINAHDKGCGARWAKSLLSKFNMKAESIEISTEFNSNYIALEKISISSKSIPTGDYMIASVIHDLIKETSELKLERLRYNIGVEHEE